MADEQPAYLSYLLRLWQVSGDGQSHCGDGTPRRREEGFHCGEQKAIWRASLESSNIGRRKVFANLDDLFGFLREQTGEQSDITMEEQPDYRSYLLRLWRVNDGGTVVWRASLESVCTGERRSFASLDDLFDFLREQAGGSPGGS